MCCLAGTLQLKEELSEDIYGRHWISIMDCFVITILYKIRGEKE